ncbi:hypothetical protein B0A55_05720 [Friedmanniomyces simplex]|uniref:FAD dependent oxidoreductase domain-containing protein n=1 Tax=Friedmanniomyces simplex TaxID=329884 RepID=A0A4U0XDK6_9PEZI|nr:hypothetical protein B0A55_05720 [Friedmanniomyces simplex]
MSTAAGGASQPPNGPPGGNDSSNEPNDTADPPVWPLQKVQNGHNDWTKNSKIKTAKCDVCSERIKIYSWQCDQCHKRICSECAEATGTSLPRYKFIAGDYLGKKCGCAYPMSGGQPPYLNREMKARGLLGPPPLRLEEDARNKKIRNDVIERKQRKAEAAGEMGTASGSKTGPASGGETQKRKNRDEVPTSGSSAGKKKSIGAHEANVDANPTIASNKPARSVKSAIKYQESSDSDGELEKHTPSKIPRTTPKTTSTDIPTRMEGHTTPTAPLRYPHLDEGETVIVGAGITGLCIARELAAKAKATKTRHTITVVELRSNYCELAASGCAGILTTKGLDPLLDDLANLATDAWQSIAQRTEMRRATDLVNRDVYRVRRFNGEGQEHKPSWFNGFGDENFMTDDVETMGKIDTAKFGDWLFRQCHELNVRFIFNHHVHDIISNPSQDVSGIVIQHKENVRQDDGARQTLTCQNVILAAGPYTTGIFKDVYPDSPLKIGNKSQFALWFPVAVDNKLARDNIGLVFPDVAAEDTELEDEVTMVGRPASHQVIVAGLGTESREGPVSPAEALDLDIVNGRPIRHLRRLAGRRLGEEAVSYKNAPRGCALVSTLTGKLPVIAKVPASALGRRCEPGADGKPNGVWLCFGFGMRGTTLAPGAARALWRRLFGEESGMQDGVVAVPGLAQPVRGQPSAAA